MHRLKRRPLTEAEAEYYTQQASESSWFTHNEVCIKAGAIQGIQRRLDDMLTAFVFSIGKAYSYVYLDARYERVLRMVWSAHRQCLSLLVLMSVGIVQYWLWDSP